MHIHIVDDEYAVRVDNSYSYKAVSCDVLERWSHRLTPDLLDHNYTYSRGNQYLHKSSDIR